MEIRSLSANEIECRVAQVTQKGCTLLLYKDARCDMKILDEVFGITGWQRSHEVINGNLFCNISIWDNEKLQWVVKQDVGTESNTEAEKGQASDSFKRACFNLGIGRELYTSPFIFIQCETEEQQGNGARKTYKLKNAFVKYHVSKIGYDSEKIIAGLEIKDSKNNVVYSFGTIDEPKPDNIEIRTLDTSTKQTGTDQQAILDYYKVGTFNELTRQQYNEVMAKVNKKIGG